MGKLKFSICYAACMQSALASRIRDDRTAHHAARQLAEDGSLSMRGPFPSDRFATVAHAYDEAMAAACGPNFSVGSTTTRSSDLLSFDVIFDEVFLYEPLLAIGSRFFGQDFKLSSFMGRTLRPATPAQALHADLPRTSEDAPLFGFILMIDAFQVDNGATRFVPGSHRWPGVPSESMTNPRSKHPKEQVSCGAPGTMVLFNAAIWHGHTANVTSQPRRSIQGYFVRREARQGFDFRKFLPERVQARMNPLTRHLLALDEKA